VWETAHGSVPEGKILHHKDGNTLNDLLANLEPVTRSRHLQIHMPEYREKMNAGFAKARRKLRWSTKSKEGKITGRHPLGCKCPLHA
jgi:hypothetical protein